MIWVLPVLAAMGVSAWIYNSVSEEEQRAQRQWHEKRRSVQKTLSEHRSHIERHIRQAQSSHDFHYLVEMHYSSVQIANAAYKLLDDARSSLNAMHTMLNNAKQRKLSLERNLAFAQGQKNRAAMARIIADLKRINASRHALFEEKNKQKAEKDKLYQEVKRLNQQTSELKQHIRHCCGSKGQIWFQNLERRKKLRGA
jgi:hypothetical protein